MTKAEQWLLDNFPRLGCALYSYKHSADRRYFVKATQTDSMVMRCECYGDDNPDKNLYYIEMGDKNNGFFAEYHKLLKFLYYADRFRFTPVVKYTGDFLYSEDHKVNGSDNPFEYYFLQPGGVSVDSLKISRNVFLAEYVHTQIPEIKDSKDNDYEVSPEYIDIMGGIAGKYIRLNDTVRETVDRASETMGVNCRTVGVHYRGTDYKREMADHPRFSAINEYIASVSGLLEKDCYDKVFLATDSAEALEEFRKEFKDMVVYCKDSIRSDSDVSVAFSESEREDHHYLLGLEVLRDMIVLSKCGALVAGLSQVSLAARITNASGESKYRDTVIISKGVSKDGADGKKYYKKYGSPK